MRKGARVARPAGNPPNHRHKVTGEEAVHAVNSQGAHPIGRRRDGAVREEIMIRLVSLAVPLLLLTANVVAQQAPPAGLVAALKAGGHVIVFRHGGTNADQADTDPLHIENVAQQRQLNDKGRSDAKAVGEVLKAAAIPLGKVYSSQFNRAVETARLISGKEPIATADLTEGGLVVSPNENARRTKAFAALAAAAPDAGTNTLIVTHKPNILDAFGKDWFEVREGEASIFKPDGAGKASLVARVQIAEWAGLAK
jgi:broad specificity phosphatase PhoE